MTKKVLEYVIGCALLVSLLLVFFNWASFSNPGKHRNYTLFGNENSTYLGCKLNSSGKNKVYIQRNGKVYGYFQPSDHFCNFYSSKLNELNKIEAIGNYLIYVEINDQVVLPRKEGVKRFNFNLTLGFLRLILLLIAIYVVVAIRNHRVQSH